MLVCSMWPSFANARSQKNMPSGWGGLIEIQTKVKTIRKTHKHKLFSHVNTMFKVHLVSRFMMEIKLHDSKSSYYLCIMLTYWKYWPLVNPFAIMALISNEAPFLMGLYIAVVLLLAYEVVRQQWLTIDIYRTHY